MTPKVSSVADLVRSVAAFVAARTSPDASHNHQQASHPAHTVLSPNVAMKPRQLPGIAPVRFHTVAGLGGNE